MRAAALLVLAALVAGCNAPGDGPTKPTTAASTTIEAPWWEVGEHWDVDMSRGGRAPERFRLVNFWNDSATNHFWLGVADRQQALDMALHDDNPLLGRIHWEILTPHEGGIHAHGLYHFPVEDGERFGGLAFGSEWSLVAKAGAPGTMTFTGTSTDGETIEYDYVSSNRWFTYIDIKDDAGAPVLRVDVRDHGTGATGTYYFARGRDYHLSTDPTGTKEEPFEVKDEGVAHRSLALELKGTVNGLLRIDVLDPEGQSRHSETLAGGAIAKVIEIPSPKVGTWTIRYAGTGTLAGTVEAVGILEYSRTL